MRWCMVYSYFFKIASPCLWPALPIDHPFTIKPDNFSLFSIWRLEFLLDFACGEQRIWWWFCSCVWWLGHLLQALLLSTFRCIVGVKRGTHLVSRKGGLLEKWQIRWKESFLLCIPLQAWGLVADRYVVFDESFKTFICRDWHIYTC